MATEQRATIADQDLRWLEEEIDGTLLLPGDGGYDEARVIHNAAYQRSPRLILQAASARDVMRGVAFARGSKMDLAVHSGGHSLAGHSSSEGMVTDLTRLRSIDINPERGVVRVEPGVTWGELSQELHQYGLAVPSGDTGSVGVGGLTVGGGIGWLVRKHGLTIDSLRSVEIVTADGRLLRASPDEHPDLFWAVRGGGGNFGIVTSFEFQAHPVGEVVSGAIIYDAAEAREVLSGWARYAAAAPERLTTITFVMYAPPFPFIPPEMHGKRIIVIGVCCTGNLAEAESAVAPLRGLGTVLADITGPAPYPSVFAFTENLEVPGLHVEIRSGFAQNLEGETLDTILSRLETMAPPMDVVQLRVLGGAMSRVPEDATAFVHRDKEVMVSVLSLWVDPAETEQRRAWAHDFWRDLSPYTDGAYVNFLADEGSDRVVEAYGPETYRRLATIKHKYDPDNVFRLNQNIEPVAGAPK